MDDKCQVDRLIREGIFLDTGDFLLIAGSSLDYLGEDWEFGSFDHNVLFDFSYQYLHNYDPDYNPITTDFDLPSFFNEYLYENLNLFEAVSSGSTIVQADLIFNYYVVKEFYFDVYVDQEPCLCATCPRSCISDCYDDEDYQECY